jgi:hypothetical protein
VPGVSLTLFWNDVAKSFERIRGRSFVTCRRRIALLEERWRANLAAEDDVKALDVRWRRLHELETERLGLSDVCRYEIRVVTEEVEIGLQGIETNERPPADGGGSNPILVDDEFGAEPSHQKELDPLDNINPTKPNEQSDQIAPIIELLRTRQREDREEADIRWEEQVLLNKRLAMMEEQVQMLSKHITQREQNSPPASRQVDVHMVSSAEVTAEPAIEAEAAVMGEVVHDIIVIDEDPAGDTPDACEDAILEPLTQGESADMDEGDPAVSEVADDPADGPMGDRIDTSAQLSAELENKILASTTKAEGDATRVTEAAIAESSRVDTLGRHEAVSGAEDGYQELESTRMTEETEPV